MIIAINGNEIIKCMLCCKFGREMLAIFNSVLDFFLFFFILNIVNINLKGGRKQLKS